MLSRLIYLVAVVGVLFILLGLAEFIGVFSYGSAGAGTLVVVGVLVLIGCWVFGGLGRNRTAL